MAFSWQESVKPAGTQNIQCDIEYLDKSYIHVYLDGAETTAFTWTSPTNIRLNSPLAAETAVLLIRKTEREYLYIEFASGAPFIEVNVDTQNTQFLHLAQELVEGRYIEGFYGNINMHRYRITNLGDPVDVRDAANKQYVDAGDARLDQRIDAEHAAWVAAVENEASIRKAADDALDVRTTNLEQTYFNANTNSFPWWTVLTVDTDTVTPGMPFTKAKVRVNGVTQTAGYSYTINSGVVKFAEVLPAGTLVDMTIGIDTEADTSAVSQIMGMLSAATGYSLVGQVPSFAALRNTPPTAVGQVIKLKAYRDGYAAVARPTGGGEFVAKQGTATDDGGSICVPTGSGDLYWQRVRTDPVINLAEYGVYDGSDITAAINSAVAYSRANNITIIEIPQSQVYYQFSGGVLVDHTKIPLLIRGGSGFNMNEVRIQHNSSTANTFGFKFYNTDKDNYLWSASGLEGIEVVATDWVKQYSFGVFSDSWRCGVKNVLFHQYRAYCPLVILNEYGWTENFYAYNVNIRHCRHGMHFYTKSAWQSFYGCDIRDYYFNHGSGPGQASDAIVLGDGTSGGYAFMYAAKIQYGGWIGTTFETGAHVGIRLKKYSIMSECKIVENYDGTKQNQYGKYFHSVLTEDPNSYAHVDYEYNSKQFSYIVIDPIAQGSTLEIAGWDSLAYPMNGSGQKHTGQSTYGVRPGAGSPISLKGAEMIYRTRVDSTSAAATGNTVLRIRGLPINTTWLVTLKIYGPGHQNSRTFTVTTQGYNFLATVVAHEALTAATNVVSVLNPDKTITNTSNTVLSLANSFKDNGLYCRTYEGAQAGSYSVGNGDAFDIVIPPAIYRGTSGNNDTPVPGNTYGIEVSLKQQ